MKNTTSFVQSSQNSTTDAAGELGISDETVWKIFRKKLILTFDETNNKIHRFDF